MAEYTKPEAIGLEVVNLIFSPRDEQKKITYYVPVVTFAENPMSYELKKNLETHLKEVTSHVNEDTIKTPADKTYMDIAISNFLGNQFPHGVDSYSKIKFRMNPRDFKLVSLVKKIDDISYIINLLFTIDSDDSVINSTITALDGLYNVPKKVILDSEKLLETLGFILNTYVREGAGKSLAKAHAICCSGYLASHS